MILFIVKSSRIRHITTDVEFDGDCVGVNSIIHLSVHLFSFEDNKAKEFNRNIKPITDQYSIKNLEAINLTREETLEYEDAELVFTDFANWFKMNITEHGHSYRWWSTNPSTDGSFINYYFYKYLGYNPLGYSCRCINSYAQGYYNNPQLMTSVCRDSVNNHAFGGAENDFSIIKKLLNENSRDYARRK